MLPKLKNSAKYLKEIKEYEIAIEKIQNPKIKKQNLDLLTRLKQETSYIDQAHDIANNKNIDPRKIRENIENIVSIRLKLRKIVKDSK